jgi:phosphotriesterase-related protein
VSAVQTVLGPVAASDLGPVLPHEHLFIDLTCYWERQEDEALREAAESEISLGRLGLLRARPFLSRENCSLDEFDVALDEAAQFRSLGGGTIVDVTPPDIGRNPAALAELARGSGLNVVAGCGHYVYIAHPPSLASEPVEAVTERLVRELTDGIGETGIRPGIIGEIGTSPELHPDEKKALRAAARAQQAVDVAITLHLHPTGRTGHEVLDVLESEGANLARVVAGHLDNGLGRSGEEFEEEVRYHRSLADRGCFIQYDTCGNDAYYPASCYAPAYWLPSDRERVAAIVTLLDDRYEDRLLLSQDVCKKTQLTRYGGLGYAHLLRTFGFHLAEAGVPERVVDVLLRENPARMLTGAPPGELDPSSAAASSGVASPGR